MKIVAVIPARYGSTRLPGKPLLMIKNKPMIWHVYNKVNKIKNIYRVVVATDNEQILNKCKELNMNVMMTSKNHPNHISRIYEVSNKIKSDIYLCVNGDEPLVDVKSIDKIIKNIEPNLYFQGAFRRLNDCDLIKDPSNIKLVLDKNNYAIYMSRLPIPYEKGCKCSFFKKYVGIECFTKKGLDFFVNTRIGYYEKIEDIDHLRFIENRIPIKFTEVKSDSISVDTQKDFEFVKKYIEKN